jgi:hypothetical protein
MSAVALRAERNRRSYQDRSLRAARPCLHSGRPSRSNGIECGECQETGKEPADMRLPCNRLLDPSHADRAEPEQQVEPNHTSRKASNARVLQA